MRRLGLGCAVALLTSLVFAAGGAQAYVLSDAGNQYGVAYVPGTHAPGATSGSCTDPWLSPDLGGPSLPSGGLCWHGGQVLPRVETFAIGWDPIRSDWATTRDFVEQFLRDGADETATGSLTSPYAVTTQYRDGAALADRAGYSILYGGGCIDYGNQPGDSTCQFDNSSGTGSGSALPPNGCSLSSSQLGTNQFAALSGGAFGPAPNQYCWTDSQLRSELTNTVTAMGLVGHLQPGYAPLLVLVTPPGVVTCLDAGGSLCSANGNVGARFCSYHSQINVGGTQFAYVVQPWTASWTSSNGCDEPDAPQIPANPTSQQLATDVGARLVSPLSQAEIAAIVNPGMNAWFASDGSEVNDNGGCVPLGNRLDMVTLGSSSQNPYYLQREFNNGGLLVSDPNALECTPSVSLAPRFVLPSPIDAGDLVAFDGSVTDSTLVVPGAGYVWDFGDGTGGVGPSAVHTYSKGGTYTVRLTVTDRGGNTRKLSQTITVLGPGGQVIPGGGGTSGLHAQLQLLPQGLRDVLHKGVVVRVSSNEPADGIATLLISRRAARRAHIHVGRGASVVVGRGSISGIKDGTVMLHIHVSRALAAKLSRLHHLTLTLRLKLITANRGHLTIDAAGRY